MMPFGAGGGTRTLRQPNALSRARAQRWTSDGRRSVVPSGGESMSDACTFCLAMLLKLALKFGIHQWAARAERLLERPSVRAGPKRQERNSSVAILAPPV